MNVTLEGKIGRLGTALREEMNRRLGDGQKAAKVAAWLNSLREVQAVLAAEFKGAPVTEKNLFKWRKFGFKNWLRRREAEAMAGEIGELPVGDTAAVTEQIAGWAAVRYLMTVRELVDRRCENGPCLKALREFCRDVLALRRSDYYDARLQLEKERLRANPWRKTGRVKNPLFFPTKPAILRPA